jgi:hypothetical protein
MSVYFRLGLRQSLSGAARHAALVLVLAAKPPKPAPNRFFGGGRVPAGRRPPNPHQGDFDVALPDLLTIFNLLVVYDTL